MGRQSVRLSDFTALSIVDDWITGILVDGLNGPCQVMKVSACERVHFRLKEYNWCDIVAQISKTINLATHKSKNNGPEIQRLLELRILKEIQHILQTGCRNKKSDLELSSRYRRSNAIVKQPSLRRLLPMGFSEKQFHFLIK